ncbi:hypothetical protein JKP88DRAFT_274046 [Tribonema minus]|uniref:Uncharacterized protein n=1 Tax=Tribonema minus TaxID=303371 RepID=A0A836CA16_9STRA|nr:hypothetical protein JKP88DRAFT_274046 [Tribonema minus]
MEAAAAVAGAMLLSDRDSEGEEPPINKPPIGARSGKRRPTVNDSNVARRIKEHPGDFRKEEGRLFCIICVTECAEEKTAVNRHVKSSKHITRKAALEHRAIATKERIKTLRQHFNASQAKGSSLSDMESVYRLETLRMLMISGIPISKLDGPLRLALEHNNYSLTDSSHMRELIIVVAGEEMKALCEELAGQHIAVIFDGTTDHAEVLAVVARWWSEFELLANILTVEETSQSDSKGSMLSALLRTEKLQATYQLEGDGPLSMVAHDVIERLSSIRTDLLPDMDFPAVQMLAAKHSRLIARTGSNINKNPPTAAAQRKHLLMHVCRGGRAALLATARREGGRALPRGTPAGGWGAASFCQRKWQNTAVDAPIASGALGDPASASGNLSAFPWRDAPAPVAGLAKFARTPFLSPRAAMHLRVSLAFVLDTEPATSALRYFMYELPGGGEAAFRACAAAIFQTKQPLQTLAVDEAGAAAGGGSSSSAPPSDGSSAAGGSGAAAAAGDDGAPAAAAAAEGGQSAQTGAQSSEAAPVDSGGSGAAAAAAAAAEADGNAEKGPEAHAADAAGAGSGGLDPHAVMEPKLADFFAAAAAQAALSGLAPCYVLHGVVDAAAVRVTSVRGLARGDTYDAARGLPPLVQLWRKKGGDDIFSAERIRTLHVDVDIVCRDTFFVRETATDAIVQGSDAVQTRTHRVRLETTQRRTYVPEDFDMERPWEFKKEWDVWTDLDWQVIDIDDWLDGNSMYAPAAPEP